jgi:hypothetical protein
LEDCGFNHYSFVGSDDSDDAANEFVDAGVTDEHVSGKVCMHAYNVWCILELLYALRFECMIYVML